MAVASGCAPGIVILQYCSQGKITCICDISSGLTGIVSRLPVLEHPTGNEVRVRADHMSKWVRLVRQRRQGSGGDPSLCFSIAHLAAHPLSCRLITYSSYNKPW